MVKALAGLAKKYIGDIKLYYNPARAFAFFFIQKVPSKCLGKHEVASRVGGTLKSALRFL
jgi:hypothetical protein